MLVLPKHSNIIHTDLIANLNFCNDVQSHASIHQNLLGINLPKFDTTKVLCNFIIMQFYYY